jgi:hypothetical protein
MKKHNLRLVLERILFASAIVRLANELITLLSMIINYPHHYETEMGF